MKIELDELKKNPGSSAITTSAVAPSANLDIATMTKEELANRLVTYQQFMAKYIVEAQEQKMKAIQAAEAKVEAKYADKLNLLTGSDSGGPAATAAAVVATPTTTADTKLFEGRSATVAAAAKAGKSRWGDAEVARATAAALGAVAPAVNGAKVNGATAPSTAKISLPVIAHGGDSSGRLYQKRNQMVAAAGAAGKSRWGEAEIQKATEEAAKGPSLPSSSASSAPAITITPEIEAADHGLRNDGGVGGPSLAERVNLGMAIVKGSSSSSSSLVAAKGSTSLYASRNARVAAAAAAGKSRWGEMENQRSATLAAATGALPSSSSSGGGRAVAVLAEPAVVPAEVEAADHGLRADGGVGGPSLAQRVNLGVALLGDPNLP